VDPVLAAKKALQAELQTLWDALEKALAALKGLGETAEPFLHEVSKLLAPNYYEVIKHPMDLDTMTRKLYAGEYLSRDELKKDVDLMVDNCCYFNDAASP
jgi:transcriptional activator SPT7